MSLTIGIAKVELSDLAADGGPGTNFETVGNTLEDSFNITNDDGSTVNVPIEESEDPIYSKDLKGTTNIEWVIPDATLQNRATLQGGTVASKVYSAPTDAVNIEKTVKITPEEGYIVQYNRVKIIAVDEGSWGRNNVLGLRVRGRILKPTKAATPVYTITEP